MDKDNPDPYAAYDERISQQEKVHSWLILHERHDDLRLKSHSHYQEEFCRMRQNNTANWILEEPKICAWITTQRPSLLWFYGKQGAGKSVLTSCIIAHLTKIRKQPTYVYCTKDHRFATICTSLIRQQIEHDEETFPTLHQMILNEEQDKVLCLDKALLKLMQSDDRIFIIDGLDKLRDDDREKVLQLFLPGNSPSKVLLVSTDLGDMRKCLAGLNNSAEIYELLPVNTQKDIARYTVEQILSLEEEFSQISPKYRRHIYDACCNTAGVFSRASQRMEKLFRQPNWNGFVKQLEAYKQPKVEEATQTHQSLKDIKEYQPGKANPNDGGDINTTDTTCEAIPEPVSSLGKRNRQSLSPPPRKATRMAYQ